MNDRPGIFLAILLVSNACAFPLAGSSTWAALGGETPALVQLTADFNRDGVVDWTDDIAARAAGAQPLFLNNNDDDDNSGQPDHADAIVNGPDDLKDLATILVRRVPTLEPGDTLTVGVDADASSRVRLFYRTSGGEYIAINHNTPNNVPTTTLAEGDLELRLEANSYATTDWDGLAHVTVTLAGANVPENSQDTITLRVAPWMMLSNADSGTELYVRAYPTRNDAMIQQLRDLGETLGVNLWVIPGTTDLYPANNIWLQDTMEIGYSQMRPDHRMNVVLKANRNKPLDNFARNELMGPDYGWFSIGTYRAAFAAGTSGVTWIDWFGNLEVTPPIPGYPHGRVYYGRSGVAQLDPLIVGMIDAQGVQGPALDLDVSFLLIKHVDEILCFVPSGNDEHPWRVLVPSVTEMLALAESWVAAGHGNLPFLSTFETELTVNSFLADTSLKTHNLNIQTNHLDGLYTRLVDEFHLRPEDLIHVPAYYKTSGVSMVPNLVNSAVVNGHFLAPMPNGPVVGGVDLLEQAFTNLLAGAGVPLQVHYLDDQQYHRWSGNVHCGTNVRRVRDVASWWDVE